MSAPSCQEIVQQYVQHLGDGFSCYEADDRLWVVSPYEYPDSDLLEVVVRAVDEAHVRISDLGETLRHLASMGFDPRETATGAHLLEQARQQHYVELDRGMLTKQVPLAELGAGLHDIFSACLAVAHLSYLARGSRPATFEEEVTQFLVERRIAFERNYKEIGQDGRAYTIDMRVRGRERDGLVQVLGPTAAGNRISRVNATYRMWSELGNHRLRATLLDDRTLSWPPSDVQALSRVSSVYRWTDDIPKLERDIQSIQPDYRQLLTERPAEGRSS
jgi:hypothetical protein